MYVRMLDCLGKNKTITLGYPNLPEYRLFTMYARAADGDMKDDIMLLFNKRDTHLQIVIASAAFSMSVDIAAGFSLESS